MARPLPLLLHHRIGSDRIGSNPIGSDRALGEGVGGGEHHAHTPIDPQRSRRISMGAVRGGAPWRGVWGAAPPPADKNQRDLRVCVRERVHMWVFVFDFVFVWLCACACVCVCLCMRMRVRLYLRVRPKVSLGERGKRQYFRHGVVSSGTIAAT
jgi:hypothetical protein